MSTDGEPFVVAVVGATATGKSDLGIALAQLLDGEVVSADASQLYRGMDIGTAKVPLAQRHGIAHHQIDVLDVTDEATIAGYQRHARADVDAVLARGRVPVVVGGSGLYVRALLDHLDLPPTDPDVRQRLEERADAEGTTALLDELRELHPVAAAAIEPNNTRRIVRALEVIELTGRPFSATMPTRQTLRPTVFVGLRVDREALDRRIERRTRQMFASGLVQEARGLVGAGLREGRTATVRRRASRVLCRVRNEGINCAPPGRGLPNCDRPRRRPSSPAGRSRCRSAGSGAAPCGGSRSASTPVRY